jgi:hypothetical protein
MTKQYHDGTDYADAAQRFLAAKDLMTRAAKASIANLPGAAVLATEALAQLELATAGEPKAQP